MSLAGSMITVTCPSCGKRWSRRVSELSDFCGCDDENPVEAGFAAVRAGARVLWPDTLRIDVSIAQVYDAPGYVAAVRRLGDSRPISARGSSMMLALDKLVEEMRRLASEEDEDNEECDRAFAAGGGR